jgi:hypothetical protein
MTNFQNEQRLNVLKASLLLNSGEVQIEGEGNGWLALLLEAVAKHPSLMDSTREADEVLQNHVNDLVDFVVEKGLCRKPLPVSDLAGNVSANSTTMRGN